MFYLSLCNLGGSDLNVAKGDILRVSQLVRGAQHSLSVTGIDRASQDDKKLSIDGELEDGTESHPVSSKSFSFHFSFVMQHLTGGSIL